MSSMLICRFLGVIASFLFIAAGCLCIDASALARNESCPAREEPSCLLSGGARRYFVAAQAQENETTETRIDFADAREVVKISYAIEYRHLSKDERADKIYPNSNLLRVDEDLIPSEAQCTSLGPSGSIEFVPTPLGDRVLKNFHRVLSENRDVALRFILSHPDPGAQLVLFAWMSPEDRRATGVRTGLLAAGSALASRLAKLATYERSSMNMRQSTPAPAPRLAIGARPPLPADIEFDFTLYLNWISMLLEDGEVDTAVRAAANLYDLILGMDKWLLPEPNDLQALRLKHDFLEAISARYEPLLPLSYVLSAHGQYGVVRAYAAFLDFEDVRLKVAMTACEAWAMIRNKEYVDSIELLRTLSPITRFSQDPNSASNLAGEAGCVTNPAFGATCRAIAYLKSTARGDLNELEESVRRDADKFYELFIDLLSRSLAADERLREHWPQIVLHIKDRLGVEAARLVDLRKKILLQQYDEALPSYDELRLEIEAHTRRKETSEAVHFAEAEYKVRALEAAGDFKQAFATALAAGPSRDGRSLANDTILMNSIAASVLHNSDSRWLVETITHKEKYPYADLTENTLTFIFKQLCASGKVQEAFALQSVRVPKAGTSDGSC